MNEELGFDNSGGINNEVTNGVDNKSSEDYSQFAIPDSEQHKEDNERNESYEPCSRQYPHFGCFYGRES